MESGLASVPPGAPVPPVAITREGGAGHSRDSRLKMATAESWRRRWIPYVWLIYLLFFLRPLFLEPTPAWHWAVSGIALGLFLWLYFKAYRVRGRVLALCIGGIFGIGAALAPLNPGATCFLVYAVAFLHRVERVGPAGVWLLAMTATAAILIWGLGLSLGAILIVMLTVGGAGISMAELERKNLALQRSRDESARLARIAERERIRRDLHDLLGHTLSVIVLKSELAAKVAESDPHRSVEESPRCRARLPQRARRCPRPPSAAIAPKACRPSSPTPAGCWRGPG